MTPDPTSLDRLHDVIAPPPVPWWPPAQGWYWVLGAAAVVALALVFRGIIHWQRNRYRREALAEWRHQVARLAAAGTRVSALTELATLLKRAALTAFPRREVAPLTGPAWLDFLNRTGNSTGFTSPTGALLERAAYGLVEAPELDEIGTRQAAELVRHWLVYHRSKAAPGDAHVC